MSLVLAIFVLTLIVRIDLAPIEWLSGRAPPEQIEIAQALDVLVSAVRLEDDVIDKYGHVSLTSAMFHDKGS